MIDSDTLQKERTALIAANLRALRRRHNLTIEDVARACGLSVPHLANVERGRRVLGGEHLRMVVQLYGYSLCVFLSYIDAFLNSNIDDPSGQMESVHTYRPILLVGRKKDPVQLRLLKPTTEQKHPAHLSLQLASGGQLWQQFLALPEPCSVIVGRGSLLIETPRREYLLEEGQYFELSANTMHRYRNHTTGITHTYIWSATACI